METLKTVAIIIILLGLGGGALFWQIMEIKEKTGKTIIWVAGIVPIPIGLFGLVCLVAAGVMLFKIFQPMISNISSLSGNGTRNNVVLEETVKDENVKNIKHNTPERIAIADKITELEKTFTGRTILVAIFFVIMIVLSILVFLGIVWWLTKKI